MTGPTVVRDGRLNGAARGFDGGSFVGRNLWDRCYAVVDEERGIVLSIVRFGLKAGKRGGRVQRRPPIAWWERVLRDPERPDPRDPRSAIEHAWMRMPTGWPTMDYGPGKASAE